MPAISPRSALILIVIAQFLGTSLWFASNAVAPEISILLNNPGILASITSSVQFGFIVGTLVFAFLSIPDRFSPRDVFFFSAVLAAIFNLMIPVLPMKLGIVLACRFMVGFFLAGIYPVGMKIASDYYQKGLGTALGFLVGATVLGTAFPHLIKGLDLNLSWKIIFWSTSLLAIVGGAIIGFFVPDGPHHKPNPKFDLGLLPKLYKITELKSISAGYFGHMWELYTFWAFVPMLIAYLSKGQNSDSVNSLLSFVIIAIGSVSCGLGGLIAAKKGSKSVAQSALIGSGICCILIPFVVFFELPSWIWIPFLGVWGFLVTADSPQFSTMVAQSVPAEYKGTAMTIVNCLGFTLTIFSIQLGQLLLKWIQVDQMLALLSIGSFSGLIIFKIFDKKREASSQSLPA
ncbi:MAG: MFS transporter [Algoriphagus sp.]|nr:MFS transporter [Algoriphagus sp.]